VVEQNEYRVNDIKASKRTCLLLEIEDVHFNFNSAVFLPPKIKDKGKSGTTSNVEFSNAPLKSILEKFHPEFAKNFYQSSYSPESEESVEDGGKFADLQLIADVYRVQEKYPDSKLLIVGHTDTVGSEADNQTLSEKRAKGVYSILTGDREEWYQTIQKHKKVEDYQAILTHLSERYNWDCHPGSIDNVHGSKTEEAVKNFQKNYNSEFNASISEDGVVGPETWKAIFDVYMKELAELLGGKDKLEEGQKKLRFLDETQPTLGCGEKYPIEEANRDNYRSEENRRVELLFFKLDEEPEIQNAEETIYGKKGYEFEYFTPEQRTSLTTGGKEEEEKEITFEEIEDSPDTEEDFEGDEYQTECEIAEDEEAEDEWMFLLAFDKLYKKTSNTSHGGSSELPV